MRLTTLAAALSSTSLSTAIITGFSAPAYLAAGRDFTFNLTVEHAQIGANDVAVMWGYRLASEAEPTGAKYEVGMYASSAYLGPDRSNTIDDVVISARVPEALGSEQYFGKAVVMEVAVTSLSVIEAGVQTTGYNATVWIERELGTVYVKSGGVGWVENGNGNKQ